MQDIMRYHFQASLKQSSCEFIWRVSSAIVQNSGPFSDFSGYERVLFWLSGPGMRLGMERREDSDHRRDAETDDDESVELISKTLDAPYQQVRFQGEWKTTCDLMGPGPCRDFNIFARRDSVRSEVLILRFASVDASQRVDFFRPGCMAALFVTLRGSVTVDLAPALQPRPADGSATITLSVGESILLQTDEASGRAGISTATTSTCRLVRVPRGEADASMAGEVMLGVFDPAEARADVRCAVLGQWGCEHPFEDNPSDHDPVEAVAASTATGQPHPDDSDTPGSLAVGGAAFELAAGVKPASVIGLTGGRSPSPRDTRVIDTGKHQGDEAVAAGDTAVETLPMEGKIEEASVGDSNSSDNDGDSASEDQGDKAAQPMPQEPPPVGEVTKASLLLRPAPVEREAVVVCIRFVASVSTPRA